MTDVIVGNSQDITVEADQTSTEVEVTSDIVGVIGPRGPTGTIVAVQDTAPLNPAIGDLWVDTSI